MSSALSKVVNEQGKSQGEAIFAPVIIISTIMVGDNEGKVHAKYETSRPYGFKQDDY